mmetsp:Transcript_19270/g.28778  ORF Transcript_19270/g.28778 Transcript_19270/m.28778 type:complete len:917 (-) Transcript_19270:200-2950(-)
MFQLGGTKRGEECKHLKTLRDRAVKAKIFELVRTKEKQMQTYGGKGKTKTPTRLCLSCGYVEYLNCAKPLMHWQKKCCLSVNLLDKEKLAMPHCFKCNADLIFSKETFQKNPKLKALGSVIQTLEEKLGKASNISASKSGGADDSEDDSSHVSNEPVRPSPDEKKKALEEKKRIAEQKAAIVKIKNSKEATVTDKDGKELGVDVANIPCRGLSNLGNTCFFNSVMQNLTATDLLRYELKINGTQGTALHDSLRGFMNEYSKGLKATKKPALSPSSVFNSVCKYHSKFRGGRQHDSHELLRALLDSLKDEKSNGPLEEKGKEILEKVKDWKEKDVLGWIEQIGLESKEEVIKRAKAAKKTKFDGSFMESLILKPKSKKLLSKLKKLITEKKDRVIFSRAQRRLRKGLLPGDPEEEKSKKEDKKKNLSFVDKVFGGKLLNCVQCLRCKHISLTPESFMDISLAIQPLSMASGRHSFSHKRGMMTKAQRRKQKEREKRRQQLARKNGNRSNASTSEKDKYKNLTKKQRKKLWKEEQRRENERKRKAKQESDKKVMEEAQKKKDEEEKEKTSEAQKIDLEKKKPQSETKEAVDGGELTNEEKPEKKDLQGQGELKEGNQPENKDVDDKERKTKQNIWQVVFRDGLNVRESPLEDAKVVGGLDYKQRVEVLEMKDAWICHSTGWTMTSNVVGTVYMMELADAIAWEEKLAEEEEEEEDYEDVDHQETPEDISVTDFYRPYFFPEDSKTILDYDYASKQLLGESKVSLTNCLRVYTSTETLPGETYLCAKCNENNHGEPVRVKARKRVMIQKLPDTLTIHFKRFAATMRGFQKVGKHVKIPTILNMAPFCVPSSPEEKKTERELYGLTGIVVHSGGMGGGHYVAYTRRGTDSWWYFSDRTVQESRESSVLGAQAYIAFYKRL